MPTRRDADGRQGLASGRADEPNRLGEAPLFAAASRGRGQRELGLLVEARADVRAARDGGETAMHLAARFGHADTVRALAALGAPVGAADLAGDTPLHHAALGGGVAAIEALVALGARVDAPAEGPRRASGMARLPIHRAAEGGHAAALEALARLGPSLGEEAVRPPPPLHPPPDPAASSFRVHGRA